MHGASKHLKSSFISIPHTVMVLNAAHGRFISERYSRAKDSKPSVQCANEKGVYGNAPALKNVFKSIQPLNHLACHIAKLQELGLGDHEVNPMVLAQFVARFHEWSVEQEQDRDEACGEKSCHALGRVGICEL